MNNKQFYMGNSLFQQILLKSTVVAVGLLGLALLPSSSFAADHSKNHLTTHPTDKMHGGLDRGKGYVNGKPCDGRRVDMWVNNESASTHFWRVHYPGGYVDATTAPHERKMIYQHCYTAHREPYGKDIQFRMSGRQNGPGPAAGVDLEVHPTSSHKGVWHKRLADS